jgi:8-oxo-dGTP pyrophosphatase MutT (NUDIX family)
MSDHADILSNAPRERRWPNQRPKDAATLVILDRRGATPKVLMGKRHSGHKFMPDKFVFPGGRIEASDRAMSVIGALHPVVERRLMARVARPTPSRARALALAAIRETFEETGLLLGWKNAGAEHRGSQEQGNPGKVPAGAWTAFSKEGVFPDLKAMHFVARAITPPRRPKRFDTRFFAVDFATVAAEIAGVVGPESELVELAWVDITATPTLDLPVITNVILQELTARIGAGFEPELPVPFYYERNGRFVREEL